MNRLRFLLALFSSLLCASGSHASTQVTLLHFSDYHSHALPSFSEGRRDQGGLARAIRYLTRAHRDGALVLSGGDMMNRGSPAWSDAFHCLEWSWFNGAVDAMAYGNHDADYGPAVLNECRASIRYPLLSANTTDAAGKPLFARYAVFLRDGIRLGVFAVAGSDFKSLIREETSPVPGVQFGDPVVAAREVVEILRSVEHVDAVVLIGHEHTDDDYALARAVPGIDLIFGSHSHDKRELTQIPGTSTWFIAPFQYLTYISSVAMTFDGKRLTGVSGNLVPVDSTMSEDGRVQRRVQSMQRQLERDPRFASFFVTIAEVASAITMDESRTRDSALGNLVTDVMRRAVSADVALLTASSLRQSLPPGRVTLETLRAALPYDNEIVVAELSGAQLQKIIEESAARRGSDFFLQVSGIRVGFAPLAISVGDTPLDPERVYRVATADYVARVAPGYREIFAAFEVKGTGLRIRQELQRELSAKSPLRGTRDGRLGD